MDLNKKMELIVSLYNKALVDNQYNLSVNWGNYSEYTINIYLENCRKYLSTMDTLDYDVREQGIQNWHQKLDEILAIFPEFQNVNEEESVKKR